MKVSYFHTHVFKKHVDTVAIATMCAQVQRERLESSKLASLSCIVKTAQQSSDQNMEISMFCHEVALQGETASFAVPTLSIRHANVKRALEQYESLKSLKDVLRRDGADGLAECKVEFSMHIQSEKDTFDFGSAIGARESEGDGTDARRILADFLRTHLLDVWHGLAAEKLESVHGRLYMFDPFVKARNGSNVNTTWHQDGASLPTNDDYFAHYYLPEDRASGLGATDWIEVAIPETDGADCEQAGFNVVDGGLDGGSTSECSSDDEALAIDWSGLSDDTRRQRISASNFLALSTAERALIVIHDSGCFHRVPLPALFRKPKRTILRIEFHGLDRHGGKLLLSATKSGLTTGSGACWSPMRSVSLPPGLASIFTSEQPCEASSEEPMPPHIPDPTQARKQACAAVRSPADAPLPLRHPGVADGLVAAVAPPREPSSAGRGLRAYVAGDVRMKQWLERQLTKSFGDLPVAYGDLA